MNIGEFRAWLEGFESSIYDNRPTVEQWAKIKTKIITLYNVTSLNHYNYQPVVMGQFKGVNFVDNNNAQPCPTTRYAGLDHIHAQAGQW